MFGFFKKKETKGNKDEIAAIAENDATLKNYQEKAQEQLGYLIEFMNDHEKDDELFRYAVKCNFTEEGKSEHMWVQVNEFVNDHFRGQLANEPNSIKLIKYGDPVNVHRSNVEDWILEDFLTKTKVGGFSSEYIRNNVGTK